MPRIKKYRFNGVFMTSRELSLHFGISMDAFNYRIQKGWKLERGNFISPKRKVQQFHKDVPILSEDHEMMMKSFVGDSECVYV
jgi:hypothetical protein